MQPANRKPTNLTLDAALVAEAKAMGLNLSQLADEALRRAVRAEKARRWQEENAETIGAKNRWIEENGLILEKYRMF